MKLQYNLIITTALLLTAAISLSACGSGKKQAQDTADSATVADDAAEELVMLPDTAYASVKELTFRVDTLLAEVDGTIAELADPYKDAPGIMTFRGSIRRDAPFVATISSTPKDIEVAWRFKTAEDKKWGGGSGWTGQPVYVEWPDSLFERFRQSGKVTEDFSKREIIVGSLDGKVYFINPESGKASRPAIDTKNPIKGSVSLDPTMNGLLYVGQGINNVSPFGQYTIDLFKHKIVQTFGHDPKAPRGWGAYDSSAVRVGDFVFRPGENGSLYKWYVPQGAEIPKLHSVLRYRRNGVGPGMESSLAVYRNYGYIGDNNGNFLCVNLNTMQPVWGFDNHDDTDASPVVAVEDGKPYVYVACEVDKQGEGFGYLTKLNALTGELVWEYKMPSRLAQVEKKHFDGGFYATPLLGRGDAEGLIFANPVHNDKAGGADGMRNRQNGSIIALDRKTGEIKWSTPLKRYAWSSPIAVMGPNNKMYIFAADTYGNAYIIDASNGEILVTKAIGSNFESSPVASGSDIFVGSRGNTIFKMTLK